MITFNKYKFKKYINDFLDNYSHEHLSSFWLLTKVIYIWTFVFYYNGGVYEKVKD